MDAAAIAAGVLQGKRSTFKLFKYVASLTESLRLASRPGPEHPRLALLRGTREEDLRGVHVALGDRALRVAGARLDVDLRVARRGGVRERRVAQVVEGAEGLLDSGPGERRLEVALREAAGFDRRPLRRVGEDEIVVGTVGGSAPLLLEDGERARPELEDAARCLALRRRESAADIRLANLDLRFEQVDCAPP